MEALAGLGQTAVNIPYKRALGKTNNTKSSPEKQKQYSDL